MPTLIALLSGPPAADAAGALYRALRPDVAFRYVLFAPGKISGLDAPAYEVVREDGAVDDPGGALLIEPFAVPDGEDERFQDCWSRARAALVSQRGHLGARLHRSVGAADFRFVHVARWSSPLMYARALQRPEVQAATALPFASHPALYQLSG